MASRTKLVAVSMDLVAGQSPFLPLPAGFILTQSHVLAPLDLDSEQSSFSS